MMYRAFLLTLTAAACLTAADTASPKPRMNQIQVLASHNSYKLAIDPSLLRILRQTDAERVAAIEYSHRPLEEQLDMGLRSLEIDVLHDPQGGRYAQPKGIDLVKERGLAAGPAFDPDKLMTKPGLKVLHIQEIDFRSSVYTFRQALALLKKWSDRNPRHLPIVIMMNAKDSALRDPRYVKPLPFDRAAFDAWDAEIREMLPPAKLITPDMVRGSYSTLEEAALAHAWPEIDQARGRFLFLLDHAGDQMKTYIEGRPSLKGRVMFVNAEEGTPEAAFRIVNEPVENLAYIQYLVRSGYMVRTRSDADTVEARKGSYERMRAAFISGAQIVSTDYYVADPSFKTNYQVRLPGGKPGRWNPLLLPPARPLPPVE